MSDKLHWGILGAGAIARKFADGLKDSETGELVAIGSRSQEKADAFGEEFGAANRHGSYEALAGDAAIAPAETQRIPVELVVRGSSGAVRGDR